MPTASKTDKPHPLLVQFDDLIGDAPLDFIGTSTKKDAECVEQRWRDRVTAFRERLAEMVAMQQSFYERTSR